MRVNRSNECWTWTGALNGRGYGVVQYHGKYWMAPRLAYFLTYGAIPNGAYVCHRCDNPACVRPDHLWLGSHWDNMADMTAKKRYHSMFGEDHPNTRIKDCEIQLMRRLHACGVPSSFIAKCFRRRPGTVDNVVKRRSRASTQSCEWRVSAAPIGEPLRRRLSCWGNIGTRNGHCLLSEADVRDIRRRLSKGEAARSISLDYPVGKHQIYQIKSGKNWSHVD